MNLQRHRQGLYVAHKQLWWAIEAARLGKGCMIVGDELWLLRGLQRNPTWISFNVSATARRWGVSRPYLSHAISMLEEENLLVVNMRKPGRILEVSLVETETGRDNVKRSKHQSRHQPVAPTGADGMDPTKGMDSQV